MASCLYVGPWLDGFRVVSRADLEATTERHRVEIAPASLTPSADPFAELQRIPDLLGVIVEMNQGWPGRNHMKYAARALGAGRRAWFYWPAEGAIECVDRYRLWTYRRLWLFMSALRAWRYAGRVKHRIWALLTLPYRVYRFTVYGPELPPPPPPEDLGATYSAKSRAAVEALLNNAAPVALALPAVPNRGERLRGTGVYLRTDFWAEITSGGSYGHTCYVAKELADTTERFVCFMGNRFALLDNYGVQQVILPRPSPSSNETDLLTAHWAYYPMLRVAFEALKPAYIYERLCMGNFCGAQLSRDLGIPYIVEYNGSEISMTKSFGGVPLVYEDVFIAAEDAAFRQATLITVVSQVVKDSLVERGFDANKILVNPNGADPDAYAPAPPAEKLERRRALGFGRDDCVIGFTGTFGGWHGVDVLAAAIPKICAASARAKFLLIGDGTHKHLVDAAVAAGRLSDRVKSVGRVPQTEGARLLGACDIFVSPHNSHMVDSKFFGSPTKLFEYMAVGEGIVGSDLEQLGEVMSPALRVTDFARAGLRVANERAVLCTPGDVDEFVAAVTALVERPEIAKALGRNARQAVLDSYSWQRHVENVWRFARGERAPAAIRVTAPRPLKVPEPEPELAAVASAPELSRVQTGDAYKDQVQEQWNNNPVGSHYAKKAQPHTLDWYLEVEKYRYGTYAPWMFEMMEFGQHRGEKVLDIGGGMGTDLSMFARHGAIVTDVDLSAGHLEHAKENFRLRGLTGEFVHHDAEQLPFADNTFDVVYSNGVIHHTPNTRQVVREIRRVLKPGGKTIVMMYAEHSLHYWYRLVWEQGIKYDLLRTCSIGEIMSRKVEITENDARPLVKVYTAKTLKNLFQGFESKVVFKRQMVKEELPEGFEKWIALETAGRLAGWNVIIKATKPRA